VRAFVARQPGFAVVPTAELASNLGERGLILAKAALASGEGLLLTPRRTDTDGFFVSLMRRTA
jgi:16S rRNA (cytosine967-C5)-methyltransferase